MTIALITRFPNAILAFGEWYDMPLYAMLLILAIHRLNV